MKRMPEVDIVTPGPTPRPAGEKRELCRLALDALPGPGRSAPLPVAFFVPGRIEVLGKHTDYCGGRSLLCAVEKGFVVAARPRADRRVRVIAAATGEAAECALDASAEARRGHWSNYPATVARRLARNFPSAAIGADIAFASSLPSASGMSSSSAFMIGIFLPLAELNGLKTAPAFAANIEGPEALAGYLASMENGRTFGTLDGDQGVGTFGGSEDHTAIFCCRAATLSQYRFAPATLEREVPMPRDHVFVVAVSGVVAEKTGAALETYNQASRSAARVLDLWRAATGRSEATLEAAVAQGPGVIDEMRRVVAASRDPEFSAEYLGRRFEQFVLESTRIIPAASDALARADFAHFGVLVDQSQDVAERWLGNQVPETIALATRARDLGAVAASAFGAGFGGSVWALVPHGDVPVFITAWRAHYQKAHPAAAGAADFFVTRPGAAASRLDLSDLA